MAQKGGYPQDLGPVSRETGVFWLEYLIGAIWFALLFFGAIWFGEIVFGRVWIWQ